jgi:hypothetical protein
VIQVAEWLPDQPALNGGDVMAKNVIPWKASYRSFPSFSALSTTSLTARCQGAAFARDNAAVVYNYAGDATKLYRLNSLTYTDASRTVGGAYATAIDDYWEFLQWGESVIATNYTDAPQVISLGATNFIALSGSPPKSRHIAAVRDFVVMGNIDDGTRYPSRVRWSAINNSTDWTVSATTQSDYQDLVGDGGWVQKIIGGEYGIVFQERAIWRMSYVGSPVIFQFDKIELARGSYAPQAVIGWGNRVFYLADDGFYMITGGATSIPIGDGKVDRYFINDLSAAYAYRINATIDPVNKLVMWAYPGTGSTGGTPNKILIYNWTVNKWSYAEVDTECFARFASTGYTLEGLDAISGSLDALGASLDSRTYTGGQQSLASFNTSHNIGTFSGAAMNATVDTKELQLFRGQRAGVQKVKALVDGASPTVQLAVGGRNSQSTAVSFDTAVTADSKGDCNTRNNSFFHRFRITTTGNFDFILGVEPLQAYARGKR